MQGDLRSQIRIQLQAEGLGEAEKLAGAMAKLQAGVASATAEFAKDGGTLEKYRETLAGLAGDFAFVSRSINDLEKVAVASDAEWKRLQATLGKMDAASAADAAFSMIEGALRAEVEAVNEAEAEWKEYQATLERIAKRGAQVQKDSAAITSQALKQGSADIALFTQKVLEGSAATRAAKEREESEFVKATRALVKLEADHARSVAAAAAKAARDKTSADAEYVAGIRKKVNALATLAKAEAALDPETERLQASLKKMNETAATAARDGLDVTANSLIKGKQAIERHVQGLHDEVAALAAEKAAIESTLVPLNSLIDSGLKLQETLRADAARQGAEALKKWEEACAAADRVAKDQVQTFNQLHGLQVLTTQDVQTDTIARQKLNEMCQAGIITFDQLKDRINGVRTVTEAERAATERLWRAYGQGKISLDAVTQGIQRLNTAQASGQQAFRHTNQVVMQLGYGLGDLMQTSGSLAQKLMSVTNNVQMAAAGFGGAAIWGGVALTAFASLALNATAIGDALGITTKKIDTTKSSVENLTERIDELNKKEIKITYDRKELAALEAQLKQINTAKAEAERGLGMQTALEEERGKGVAEALKESTPGGQPEVQKRLAEQEKKALLAKSDYDRLIAKQQDEEEQAKKMEELVREGKDVRGQFARAVGEHRGAAQAYGDRAAAIKNAISGTAATDTSPGTIGTADANIGQIIHDAQHAHGQAQAEAQKKLAALLKAAGLGATAHDVERARADALKREDEADAAFDAPNERAKNARERRQANLAQEQRLHNERLARAKADAPGLMESTAAQLERGGDRAKIEAEVRARLKAAKLSDLDIEHVAPELMAEAARKAETDKTRKAFAATDPETLRKKAAIAAQARAGQAAGGAYPNVKEELIHAVQDRAAHGQTADQIAAALGPQVQARLTAQGVGPEAAAAAKLIVQKAIDQATGIRAGIGGTEEEAGRAAMEATMMAEQAKAARKAPHQARQRVEQELMGNFGYSPQAAHLLAPRVQRHLDTNPDATDAEAVELAEIEAQQAQERDRTKLMTGGVKIPKGRAPRQARMPHPRQHGMRSVPADDRASTDAGAGGAGAIGSAQEMIQSNGALTAQLLAQMSRMQSMFAQAAQSSRRQGAALAANGGGTLLPTMPGTGYA
jgi:hypothetical protein